MTGFLRDRDTICPRWCERPADHVTTIDHWDHRHTRAVTEIVLPEIDGIRSPGEKPISVEIHGYVDYERREYPPIVHLTLAYSGASPDEEDLTPAEARMLASALLEAADTAET